MMSNVIFVPYITLKSIYNFLSHVFKIPYHLFAQILLLQHITYPSFSEGEFDLYVSLDLLWIIFTTMS